MFRRDNMSEMTNVENLLSQWASQAQQEQSNNNNSNANHKSGNHMNVNQESVTAPADSSESSSRLPLEGTASSSRQQPTPMAQGFQDFPIQVFFESNYYMQDGPNYVLPHDYSPDREDIQNGGENHSRYSPYQNQHRFPQGDRANSVCSSSPRSSLQCDKCGAFCEDSRQLAEHVRYIHPTSPNNYPDQPQYQKIGASSQHQMQRHQQPQMHTLPQRTSQQQSGFDFSGETLIKTESKHEFEDQAEILDLDSHEIQTHSYVEDLIRAQRQQQRIQMQMQKHAMQHQQRTAPESVRPQFHEYHPGTSPVGLMNSPSPMPDQSQFIRAKQMPLEPPRHGGSPIITSTQPLVTHQLAPALPVLLQQSQKPLVIHSWKSNKARRPKNCNCTTCNKWFTSSGHLKRHYKTTLHKNAVKASNQPDPADMRVHLHPGRNAVNTRGEPRSPELSSSGSPPNLMSGPSGEATRGLMHPPTATTTTSSSNSSESSEIQGRLSQQQVATAARITNLVPLNCLSHSPIEHPHHQMGAPSPQLGQRNLQMNTPPMGVHRRMNSPIISIQHPPTHLNSPSPMGQHHYMSSTSPMMRGVPPMAAPPLPPMGGTMTPHQPYTNDLPPHVTTTTSIQSLIKNTSLTATGNDLQHNMQFAQEMLRGFGTFNNTQRLLSNFTNFGMNPGYNLVGYNQSHDFNMGGLNPEENVPPPDRSCNAPISTYDTYLHSSQKYESLKNMDGLHYTPTDGNMYVKYQEYLQQNAPLFYDISMSRFQMETNNNNLPDEQPKEELNPNIKRRKNAGRRKRDMITKEQQVTSTNPELPYLSEDGRYKCHDCNKYFNKSCYLTQHNQSFHVGDKPFKCNQCGKRFPHEKLHVKHLQKHVGEKPHKCQICPKQFNYKTDLRRHMCLHTGKRPYVCDICQKSFIRNDHMKKHVEAHKKKQSIVQLNVHLRA